MNDERNNASPWLALLVGALIVAIGLIAYFRYAGPGRGLDALRAIDFHIMPPRLPDAPKIPSAPIPQPQ